MIKFTFNPYTSEDGDKYIDWEATWDGNHDDDWYKIEEDSLFEMNNHPFCHTLDYESQRDYYEKFKFEEENPKNMMSVGDVVADNSVTRVLCEMLSDPKKNIVDSGTSGNSDCFSYYRNLLGCLSRLWD